MKNIALLFSFLIFTLYASAQKYTPTDKGSKVHFIIKNFGINTGGDLSGLEGTIIFVPGSVCNFNVSVKVKTIDTDNSSRDADLKSEKYFDAEKYPLITMQSTKVNTTNKSSQGWYYFTGNLTMHGVTKVVSFPFRAIKKGDDYLFAGEFSVNRLDYGVGSNSTVLSNTVKVSLSVLAKKS